MDIYYVNSENAKIQLSEWPIAIEDVTELFVRGWDYEETANISKNYTSIESFYRTKYEKKINIQVFADSEAEFKKCMNNLLDVTEKDVVNLTPGKLYCNDYYLKCYFCDITPGDYEELYYAIDNEVKIISPFPFWIKEHEYHFKASEISSSNNKKYAYRYAYRYANGLSSARLINEHFSESNFKMIIYGPVINPNVIIGGYEYYVNTILEEGEYLEIDSATETVYKTMRTGVRVNLFHNRSKRNSIFRPIQTGMQEVSFNGKFNFDIVIYEERSEPKW